jgi:hypothetical protein
MKILLFIISLLISITSYAQKDTKTEALFKSDSIKQMMKSSHPDLWKKYRTGHFIKYNIGSNYYWGGCLVFMSGLAINLSTDSKKQTAEVIANQKRIGKNLMEVGGTIAVAGIVATIIGSHKQKVAIRKWEERTQNRHVELQFGIMSSGGLGLALKF